MLNLSIKLFFFFFFFSLFWMIAFQRASLGSWAFREKVLHPESSDEFPSTSYICMSVTLYIELKDLWDLWHFLKIFLELRFFVINKDFRTSKHHFPQTLNVIVHHCLFLGFPVGEIKCHHQMWDGSRLRGSIWECCQLLPSLGPGGSPASPWPQLLFHCCPWSSPALMASDQQSGRAGQQPKG